MKEVYEEMVALIMGSTIFTDAFDNRLFAIYGRENVAYPLAVYTPQPINYITKDAKEYAINLGFYFGSDQLTECIEFYDAFKPVLENSSFQVDIVSPEFDIELQTNTIIVQLKKIK